MSPACALLMVKVAPVWPGIGFPSLQPLVGRACGADGGEAERRGSTVVSGLRRRRRDDDGRGGFRGGVEFAGVEVVQDLGAGEAVVVNGHFSNVAIEEAPVAGARPVADGPGQAKTDDAGGCPPVLCTITPLTYNLWWNRRWPSPNNTSWCLACRRLLPRFRSCRSNCCHCRCRFRASTTSW